MRVNQVKSRIFSRRLESSSERGAGLIEFSFVFPFLLLFMVGISEFGRGYKIYQNITNATREGARLSSKQYYNQPTNAPDMLRNRMTNYISSLGLDPSLYQGTATSISGTTAWEYGDYPNGAYLRIDQAKTFPKVGSPGNVLTGSQIEIRYPYSFVFFGPVVRLVVPNSTPSNSIFLKNSTFIQNE
ncbi:MAG: pilus assembly protein [Acidobacteria bacterium]|jgi:Flp pilus assembly protein TadG|nr:pilus assembly protein [Acidobacteriota bacterium]MCI0724800.1 pilus assembly protein [Acidobacteriota bacterium]